MHAYTNGICWGVRGIVCGCLGAFVVAWYLVEMVGLGEWLRIAWGTQDVRGHEPDP